MLCEFISDEKRKVKHSYFLEILYFFIGDEFEIFFYIEKF